MNPLVFSYNRHAVLIECLARRGPPVARSRHFALYQIDSPAGGELVIVHSFVPAQIDNNIGYYVAGELLPLLDTDRQADFEHLVGAIVRSMDLDERRAWRLFYTNSLAALERAMAAPEAELDFIGPFGAIYRRVAELVCGPRLLDVGACFGFLPLVLARRQPLDAEPGLMQITGCDLNAALVNLANDYAAYARLDHIRFVVADLLADESERLGRFDTVTAIHLLEHLESWQNEAAVANLWRLTRRRLIIAVPLEATPDPRFGHRQAFNQERLLALGQQFAGNCRYFEHHGGWLVVDKRN